MAALQYVEKPTYNALLVRKTYGMLAQPGALMDLMHEWTDGMKIHWDHIDNMVTFPSGAQLKFGYFRNDADRDQYQGANYHFIGVDELTQFEEKQYTWLMSRNRKPVEDDVPLRIWASSNPGSKGHQWVKQRFILEGAQHNRRFIRARLGDNPHLSYKEYSDTLSNLDPITRRQLLLGDWDAVYGGGFFKREWFEIIKEGPSDAWKVRYWDMAATPETPSNPDPDYTAGAKVGLKDGTYYIFDVRRTRATPQDTERLVKQTASLDGQHIPVVMEQEPGASGVQQIDYFRRFVLPSHVFKAYRPTGPKDTRISIVSSHAEAGNIKLVEGNYISSFFDEAETYPDGHDDQLDAIAGAIAVLQQRGPRDRVRWIS
jgi:predicted phage terminase large subunit-like protein